MKCKDCTPEQKVCEHVRVDGKFIDPEDEYYFALSYVGGHAVVTCLHHSGIGFRTAVVCVGFKTLAQCRTGDEAEARRVLLTHDHRDWDFVDDIHEATVIGLYNGMFKLNTNRESM